tara:strand:- start:57 stop:1187 length:1131 start_codon:yes stop_codon:yes gene_type:complete
MAKELLKEAIADAKAVREVALQNAKMALEEAFDSKIKNMLSAKLAEEIEEDVELEEEYNEDEKSEGMTHDEDDKVDEMSYEEDDSMEEDINLDELMAELEEMSYDEDDDMKEEYDEDEKVDEARDEEVEEGVGAKLAGGAKAIGKSLLTYPADVVKEMEAELKKNPELENNEKFMAGLKAAKAFAAVASGAAGALKKDGKGGFSEGKEEDDANESIDIDALISEIENEIEEGKKKKDDEDDMKEGKKKDKEEKEKMKEELAEALSTVTSLKSTITEMNLLNSKLLYCNKLFRANALTEAQKVKVVDALDKSTTTGEAKLVFETLQESFNFTGVEKRAIKEGLGRASKAAGTAPKKVITESADETVSRFQKLANIKL